jgi:DNA-binding NtrC family response regulator
VNKILLCTHDPISIKNIYGILRDEGFGVETADHAALAVRMVLEQNFSAVIIDSQPFGLPVGDAIKVIKTVSPETTVILVGCNDADQDGPGINMPMDLSELKNLIHNVMSVSKNFEKLRRKEDGYDTERNNPEGVRTR